MPDSIERDMSDWYTEYTRYEPEKERLREALCTLGNGYFATRGAFADVAAVDDRHYPGTYVAGLYNRLVSKVEGHEVENEDLVNVPNWLPLTFRIGDGAWFSIDAVEILSFLQRLDLRRGELLRDIRFRDAAGRTTRWRERRLVSMADCHVAALQVELTPEDWEGEIVVQSVLDAGACNAGVARYAALAIRHLETLETHDEGRGRVSLRVRTTQSRIEIVQAARLAVTGGGGSDADVTVRRLPNSVQQEAIVRVGDGPLVIEKTVALHTGRDPAIAEPRVAALETLDRAEGYEALALRHALSWRHLWDRCDIGFEGPDCNGEQRKLRLHIFHLLQTISPHSVNRDVGIPARGWHGEAYRGHIFWDELFILPFLTLRLPHLVREAMRYRFRRIGAARRAAAAEGFRGAMFPWQSGSDGREESQRLHLNPRSGRWIPDRSHRQRHVNGAICYNIWRYWEATNDTEFMYGFGAEMFLSIAQFWGSLASYNPASGRYDIKGVVGPDEFHTAYPDAAPEAAGGLNNNAYTNVLVAWLLARARDVMDLLPPDRLTEIMEITGLDDDECERWQDVGRKLQVPLLEDGIISQFEGYESLRELDWRAYTERYGNIQRLDRILEAEGDDVNRYKVSKQADVLMIFYLFSAEEVVQIFEQLGHAFDPQAIRRNVDYHLARTSHGSTLSLVTHAWVLARSDREHSWRLFQRGLDSDIADIQGGTTEEGIHTGAMAGTVDLVQRNYLGLETRSGILHFNPMLPEGVDRLHVGLQFRQHRLEVEVTPATLEVRSRPEIAPMIDVAYRSHLRKLVPGGCQRFALVSPSVRLNGGGGDRTRPEVLRAGTSEGDTRQQQVEGGTLRFDPAACRLVIFDMDGVVTDTAELHFAAWKALFDGFLREHARSGESAAVPFSLTDYRTYVDGKPRLDGLRSFLSARDISVPEGGSGDPPEADTIRGLAVRKNALFRDCLAKQGVTPFQDTVDLIGRLKAAGVRVAAISSSRNAEQVLKASNTRDLFDVLIEGNRAAAAGLKGKPAPDIFLHAAAEMGADPAVAAVVEDAVSGVAAARAGGFGLVVGLARHGGERALRDAGADVVVSDLTHAVVCR